MFSGAGGEPGAQWRGTSERLKIKGWLRLIGTVENMPTYEYRCAEGHDFEQLQKMSDPPIEICPVCGAAAERQLSAGAGLLFKGSGFYITDYRSDNYKKAAESDKGAAGTAGGPTPPKADKPASEKSSSSGGSSSASPAGGSSSASGGASGSTGSAPKGTSGGSSGSKD